MASFSFSIFLPLFFFLLTIVSSSSNSIFLPITKDNTTQQYTTTLSFGTPFVATNLVVDLSGSHFWVDCSSTKTSSSLSSIPHRSVQCLTAKSHTQTWLSSLENENPIDQDSPCEIVAKNTITGKVATEGKLVEDVLAVKSMKDSVFEPAHEFLFTCSNTLLLNGLSNDAKGIVGFGRSRTSFSSQFFNSIDSDRKITFCLSSSSGFVSLGRRNKVSESEIFRSLTFTPLVTNQNMEYFINVNSIKIGGKKVSFNTLSLSQEGNSGTLLSSIVPYTTMQSSIYDNFKSAFLKAALSMNISRVDSVAPFEICFGSNGIGESKIGPNVPVIDLVLQSEMVKWRIHGRNSMVRVSDDVMCLGILDGGDEQKNPIVIGGYQLEDVLVQFDFDSSMVGFSSSLLIRDTSCSNFRFGSMDVQSS